MVPSPIVKGKDDRVRQPSATQRLKQLQKPVLSKGIEAYFVTKDVVGQKPADK